jgi:hypothetical protein
VANEDGNKTSYEVFYRDFDLPVMRQMRIEAYGEDLGQHSWVSAEELRRDIHATVTLKLGAGSGVWPRRHPGFHSGAATLSLFRVGNQSRRAPGGAGLWLASGEFKI